MDRLAKEAAVEDGPIVYDRIPRETIVIREKENGLRMWQQQWMNARKGAVTKSFFPSVRNRLQQKIPIFQEFTTMVTGHGKLRSYLHRCGLTDNPMCPCKEEEEQTTDYLIFQCQKLRNQRNEMVKQIKKTGGNWPTTKETLVNNYLKIVIQFVKSIDFRFTVTLHYKRQTDRKIIKCKFRLENIITQLIKNFQYNFVTINVTVL